MTECGLTWDSMSCILAEICCSSILAHPIQDELQHRKLDDQQHAWNCWLESCHQDSDRRGWQPKKKNFNTLNILNKLYCYYAMLLLFYGDSGWGQGEAYSFLNNI